MKVTLNWLKEFVPIRKSAEDLATALTNAGLPVASLENPAKSFDGIVVGKILKIEKHLEADKLTVCRVDVGKEVLQIVCGAQNMKEQDMVPVATLGTVLPGGMRIEQVTIRGESSFGMMCSKRELGLGDDQEGLFILQPGASVGKSFAEVMGWDDTILDVEVTPNRPDCLSVVGIAREIATITGTALRTPSPLSSSLRGIGKGPLIPITIEAKNHCWMYCGCLLEDVQVGPSPDWLKKRLEMVGLRSVNNVVDITNYVLMEQGGPLHAFDADLLQDSRICVRQALEGESLKTIDQVERPLDSTMLVIADGKRPVALAGVMGGACTEISAATRRVFLESALFAPACVRKTSKKLGLASDSSYRFERGVDPQNVARALRHAIALLKEFAHARPCAIQKVACRKFPLRKIAVDPNEIGRLLGMNLTSAALIVVLKRLNFTVARESSKRWNVIVPSYRMDVACPADLAEEFARINGYEKIPTSVPTAVLDVTQGSVQPDESVRKVLLGEGFNEVVHASFMSVKRYGQLKDLAGWRHELVELENPIDQDQRFLRPTLADALLGNISLNQSRGAEQSHIFEIANVFTMVSGKVRETKMLGIAGAGPLAAVAWEGKNRLFDFFDLKGTVEGLFETLRIEEVSFLPDLDNLFFQPGQACRIAFKDQNIGFLGKVHPAVASLYDLRTEAFLCEMAMAPVLDYARTAKLRYHTISKFPAIVRDVAVMVDKAVSAGALHSFLKGYRGDMLEDVGFFDLFQGENIPPGKKSLAYRLCYRSQSRTLTEAEVQAFHSTIVDALRNKWGCELREG